MADVRKGVKNPTAVPAGHAHHDRVLVSRYAAEDAYPGEIEQARQLIERCPDCAALAHDVGLLRSAVSTLPAPRRERDFRITAEQAERLRGSALDRLLRRLAAPGLAPLRPIAGVAMSLGLVLAVVGAALPTPAGVAPAAEPLTGGEPAEMAPGSTVAPGSALPPAPGELPGDRSDAEGPTATDGRGYNSSGDQVNEDDLAHVDREFAAQDASAGRQVLVFGGLAIALLSLGALALVVVARRRMHDPLLR